jgi:hypothetical protein
MRSSGEVSVAVPTVDRALRTSRAWSTTMAADRSSTESTSGRPWCGRRFCRKAEYVSLISRCDSAAMVSNTSDDFPDPDTPVTTVSRRFGMSSDTSRRLFSRAPRTRIAPYGSCPSATSTSTPRTALRGTTPRTAGTERLPGRQQHGTPYGDRVRQAGGMATEFTGTGDPARSMALLWRTGEEGGPRPGPRAGLDVDRVVSAAVRLADARGWPRCRCAGWPPSSTSGR